MESHRDRRTHVQMPGMQQQARQEEEEDVEAGTSYPPHPLDSFGLPFWLTVGLNIIPGHGVEGQLLCTSLGPIHIGWQ